MPWSASDTHASPRARSSRGTSNVRQVATPNRQRRLLPRIRTARSVPLPGAAARAPTKQDRDARLQLSRSSSLRAWTFQARHSKSCLCRQTTRDVARGQRPTNHPRRSPRLSRAYLFKLRSGEAGGVTGARRAERIYAAQYLMALSSEHGGAEGVAAREGTGAQGAPN